MKKTLLLATAVLMLLVPFLHLAFPAGHPLHLSEFYVGLLGKFLCFAICALALDLIWGFGGTPVGVAPGATISLPPQGLSIAGCWMLKNPALSEELQREFQMASHLACSPSRYGALLV